MDYHDRFGQLFSDYRGNYIHIFNRLYPAKHDTGFTERNLSVNFAKAYEAKNPAALTWYELQFGEKNNLHYDAIIIDPQGKEILLIESKRFNNPSAKIQQVIADIGRINRAAAAAHEFSDRITEFAAYTLYGVVLADVWSQSPQKIKIWHAFENHSFLDDFCSELPEADRRALAGCSYHVGNFIDLPASVSPSIRENYHLLALTWKLPAKQ